MGLDEMSTFITWSEIVYDPAILPRTFTLKLPEKLSPVKLPPCFSMAALALISMLAASPSNGIEKLHLDIIGWF
jgi:hypothetical protein